MPNENKRDLAADLAICEAATAGPWMEIDGVYVMEMNNISVDGYGDPIAECNCVKDAAFIAEARTGWPHAIERALAAEAEVRRLIAELRTACRGLDVRLDEIGRLRKENAALRRQLPITNEQAAEQLRAEREGRRR